MCGIFGFVGARGAPIGAASVRDYLQELFRLSEPRGQEASGLAIAMDDVIHVFKRGMAPRRMLKTLDYRLFLNGCLDGLSTDPDGRLEHPLAVIGHCRLVTNGAEIVPGNNHPIMVDRTIGIHNGIVTNDQALWSQNPDIARRFDSDSEILFRLIDHHAEAADDLKTGLRDTFTDIEGSASVAFFRRDAKVLGLATNLGSLYFLEIADQNLFVFASEAHILQTFVERKMKSLVSSDVRPRQLKAGKGCLVAIDAPTPDVFELDERASGGPVAADRAKPAEVPFKVSDHTNRVSEIRRCTQCILPETYPFIEFDDAGVCQYCREYEPFSVQGEGALEEILARHRSKDGSPDCIVAFSGGRDSSYGLHRLKTHYGMTPIAFTYDWGMVTGIARRNQARILGKLNVEHILRAADIPTKRRYIRKNIQAWLKNPHLGMIPLFTAGDKFFLDIARELKQELNIPLVIFCAGNELERTDFKTGYAGVRESKHGQVLFNFSLGNKIQLAAFYASQYLRNPAYINESLFDSLHAFRSSFISKDDFLYFFHYEQWDEDAINQTLRREYAWETAPDNENTWRIGDGYTTFMNYIYYTVGGFSEFDAFRSQQVRKGLIERERAIDLTAQDNDPDMNILYEFAQQVGINLEEVLSRINEIPKRY